MKDELAKDLHSLRIERGGPAAPKATRGLLWMVGGGLVALLLVVWIGRAVTSRFIKADVELGTVELISPVQNLIQVTSTGYVVPQVASKVGARVLGRVAEVLVSEGQTVEAGQLLVRLEDAESRSALAGARARALAASARSKTAKANLSEVERQLARENQLAASGASARSVVEDLTTRVQSLREAVNAAEAEAQAARAEQAQLDINQGYMKITAPIGGRVIGKPADVGVLVGPQTAPVVELADFTTLMVETDVPEGRLHLVTPGGPAEIVLDAYPTRRMRGEVGEISPRVNRAKATVIVKVKFSDAPTDVLPDMAARVSFLSETLSADSVKEPARLFVPGRAILSQDDAKWVMAVEDGKAALTRVELGAPMASGFEVKSGVREGTKVVLDPGSLRDGQTVQERK